MGIREITWETNEQIKKKTKIQLEKRTESGRRETSKMNKLQGKKQDIQKGCD